MKPTRLAIAPKIFLSLAVGGVLGLLGIALVGSGAMGLVEGMHGGPVSAIILILLGLGPLYLGYVLVTSVVRMLRKPSNENVTK